MVLNGELSEGIIMGMGNPLLDISANVPMDVLKKYNVTLNNACLAEEAHMPLYRELVDNYEVEYIAGGATQNSIRVAQWMLKAPGCTTYAGCVGKDAYGEQLATCARKDGVRTLYQVDADTPTGTCAVLVNGGERSLVANLSAANKYQTSHTSTADVQAALTQAQIVYIAGFFLTVSPESITSVGEHCVAHDKLLCLNLSAPFIIEFFGAALDAALPFTSFVFANETEAATLGKVKGWGDNGADLKEVARKLAATPKASGSHPRTVVFTQGAGATIVCVGGVVREFPTLALEPEALVDTNGAGDAFVGGYLSQLVKGESVEACVRAGSFAARTIIQRSGCTFPDTCDYE